MLLLHSRFNVTELEEALFARIATVIALGSSSDFISRFSDLLSLLLYLFTPWTAINLVDFYLIRKGHYSVREIFNPDGMYGRWNWRGLLAYGIGFAVMIPFFRTEMYTGPVAQALGGADIAMLIGLPAASAVYLLACRSLDIEQDRKQAAAADLGLDGAESLLEPRLAEQRRYPPARLASEEIMNLATHTVVLRKY